MLRLLSTRQTIRSVWLKASLSNASRVALPRSMTSMHRLYSNASSASTTTTTATSEPVERLTGEPVKQSFKAETKRLLEIVANSLYSEKEVFIRELTSNASDACEKLKYYQLTKPESLLEMPRSLEIHIVLDKENKKLTIQDFGIGMTRKELENNLGTIALSGASSFIEQTKSGSSSANQNIIGQFGVGFYSAFTVASNVEVYSRSALRSESGDSKGYCWRSDGLGDFTMTEADNVAIGTKIVMHLKNEELKYADKSMVESIIKKYSNFVGFPVLLNGTQVNTIQPLWTLDKSGISAEQYDEFYKFIADSFEPPLYHLHFSTDAPIQIRSLLFIPKSLPFYAFQKTEEEPQISLYSKKILIKSKTNELLPPWLSFVRGVVDSEDIPLNLSRELLQNNLLIQKLKRVLTSRVVKWLQEEHRKNPSSYASFYKKIAPYLKGGVLQDPDYKTEITGLLLFESSHEEPGKLTTLKEYLGTLPAGQEEIYIGLAPSREAALRSPYYEPFKSRDIPVLFSFDKMDEFLVNALGDYEGKKIVRIEDAKAELLAFKQNVDADANTNTEAQENNAPLNVTEAEELSAWFTQCLDKRVKSVKASSRMFSHPALIVDHASLSMTMKYFKSLMAADGGDGSHSALSTLPPVELELNTKHPVIKALLTLRSSDPQLAESIGRQVFDNALIEAGLFEESHDMVSRLNGLLTTLVNEKLKSATSS